VGASDAELDREAANRALVPQQDPAFGIVAAAINRGDRVLDIGAGLGTIAEFLAPRGAVIDGIEPVPERAERARHALRNLAVCPLEQAAADPALERDYDVVLLLDVLEHLVDPVEGLRQAAHFLAPEGRMYLFLPNSAHWTFRRKILRGDWRYHPHGLFDRTHLRFFDTRTAAKLPRQAGLSIAQRWYPDHDGGRLAALGIRLRPNLFAFHVLFELRHA
jgi:SAM-dependent methyltransferase